MSVAIEPDREQASDVYLADHHRFDRGRIVQVWSIVDKARLKPGLRSDGGCARAALRPSARSLRVRKLTSALNA